MIKAIECKNLKKIYGDDEPFVHALRGANFEMDPGELVIIVGPSGSGKTTFLSIVSGILHQTSGDCLIYGENINEMHALEKVEFRKKNIGFIFQSLHLIPTLTAIENISIPLILNDVPEKNALEQAKDFMAKVGLSHRKNVLPGHMSGGEQQRVAICRGCIHRPKLILCDEPTSTLDREAGITAVKLLKDVAQENNSALLIVTHDPRIFEFADRIVKMEDGRVVQYSAISGH